MRAYAVTFVLPYWIDDAGNTTSTGTWIVDALSLKNAEAVATKEIKELYQVSPVSVKASSRKVTLLDVL